MERDCHGRPAQKAGVGLPADATARLQLFRADTHADPSLRCEPFPLSIKGTDFLGHICYFQGPGEPAPAQRPLVIIVHNYAGMKQFDLDQAAYIARSGFTALAVDMYGADSPPETRVKTEHTVAMHYQTAFFAMNKLLRDQHLFRDLLQAWLTAGRAHRAVEPRGRTAAMGYCFGGMAMFEMVRAGMDVDAVISFHGVLQSDPIPLPGAVDFDSTVRTPPNTYGNLHTKVLVENGNADPYVTQAARDMWTAEMDAAGVDWVWHDHARTPHGFALAPDICTEYTEAADRRSTQAMWAVLDEVWPDARRTRLGLNACGTPVDSHWSIASAL